MWLSKVDDKFNRQQHCILSALMSDKIRNNIFKATHLDERTDKNKTKSTVYNTYFSCPCQRNCSSDPIGKVIKILCDLRQ